MKGGYKGKSIYIKGINLLFMNKLQIVSPTLSFIFFHMITFAMQKAF